jgi:hypothetical protein
MCYGYRAGEVVLPDIGDIKPSLRFSRIRPDNPDKRNPAGVCLPCHFVGAAYPKPDLGFAHNMVLSVKKRFGALPPPPVKANLDRLGSFVDKWLEDNLRPLSFDSDLDFERNLETLEWTMEHKQRIRDAWLKLRETNDELGKPTEHKSFGKDESYATYKHARSINGLKPEGFAVWSAITGNIESVLFALDPFIKKVSGKDRPQKIYDKIFKIGGRYIATDYSSFEALFTQQLMEAIEFRLFAYMVGSIPRAASIIAALFAQDGDVNTCIFKFFTVYMEATRMSGDPWTSLFNSFANLMLMYFVCFECKCDVVGFVEGDDGIFRVDPREEGRYPREQDFTDLGLLIKLEIHERLEEASFCGVVFDPIEMINITDPIKAVLNFGWASAKYSQSSDKTLKALMRCKALSLAYQYSGCPIVSVLAHKALSMTKGMDVRSVLGHRSYDIWHAAQVKIAYQNKPWLQQQKIGGNSRLIVERKFGIPIDVQLHLEKAILDSEGPINSDVFLDLCGPDTKHFWNTYVRDVDISCAVNYPVF